jgi:hypothetical protein
MSNATRYDSKEFRTLQNAVCDASTGSANGNKYYRSIGHAYGAIDSKLLQHGHRIAPDSWAEQTNGKNFSAVDGVRFNCEVWDDSNSHAADLVVSAYRMASGNYELTVYLC